MYHAELTCAKQQFMDPDVAAREAAKTLRSITAALRTGKPPMITHTVGGLIAAAQELNATLSTSNTVTATSKPMIEPNDATNQHVEALCRCWPNAAVSLEGVSDCR